MAEHSPEQMGQFDVPEGALPGTVSTAASEAKPTWQMTPKSASRLDPAGVTEVAASATTKALCRTIATACSSTPSIANTHITRRGLTGHFPFRALRYHPLKPDDPGTQQAAVPQSSKNNAPSLVARPLPIHGAEFPAFGTPADNIA